MLDMTALHVNSAGYYTTFGCSFSITELLPIHVYNQSHMFFSHAWEILYDLAGSKDFPSYIFHKLASIYGYNISDSKDLIELNIL